MKGDIKTDGGSHSAVFAAKASLLFLERYDYWWDCSESGIPQMKIKIPITSYFAAKVRGTLYYDVLKMNEPNFGAELFNFFNV